MHLQVTAAGELYLIQAKKLVESVTHYHGNPTFLCAVVVQLVKLACLLQQQQSGADCSAVAFYATMLDLQIPATVQKSQIPFWGEAFLPFV